ncbi:unnamed protein product [Phytophthora fragariaefolia]|uniref:Unnamed protein product n=1 Tax=Phytophthora fragariaefolia TaxID=1490495 RepID=A0A9W7D9M4_9STRA|nr:unnamed protein product [Phytophthora fragariaefolia]
MIGVRGWPSWSMYVAITNVQAWQEDQWSEHVVMATGELDGKKLLFINIYAMVQYGCNSIGKSRSSTSQKKQIICGGDFNCVDNNGIDRIGGSTKAELGSRELNHLMAEMGLQDAGETNIPGVQCRRRVQALSEGVGDFQATIKTSDDSTKASGKAQNDSGIDSESNGLNDSWTSARGRRALVTSTSWSAKATKTCFFRRICNKFGNNTIPTLVQTNVARNREHHDKANIPADSWTEIFNGSAEDKASIDKFIEQYSGKWKTIDMADLDAEFSEVEVQAAIDKCKSGKACGPNELPNEWYRHHGKALVPVLTRIFNDCMGEGHTPSSFLEAYIFSIGKGGGTSNPHNYRPIALLNSDYTIFTRILAWRVRAFIVHLVSSRQCGFVPGRTIHEVIDLLEAAKEVCRNNGQLSEAQVMLLDFAKAYDSTIHGKREIIREAESHQRHPSRLPAGASSFIIAVDLLHDVIDDDEQLQGIQIGGITNLRPLKVAGYADDTAIYIAHKAMQKIALQAVRRFSAVSGLKLNVQKSAALQLGKGNEIGDEQQTHDDEQIHKEDNSCEVETTRSTRYLGHTAGSGDTTAEAWDKAFAALSVDPHQRRRNNKKKRTSGYGTTSGNRSSKNWREHQQAGFNPHWRSNPLRRAVLHPQYPHRADGNERHGGGNLGNDAGPPETTIGGDTTRGKCNTTHTKDRNSETWSTNRIEILDLRKEMRRSNRVVTSWTKTGLRITCSDHAKQAMIKRRNRRHKERGHWLDGAWKDVQLTTLYLGDSQGNECKWATYKKIFSQVAGSRLQEVMDIQWLVSGEVVLTPTTRTMPMKSGEAHSFRELSLNVLANYPELISRQVEVNQLHISHNLEDTNTTSFHCQRGSHVKLNILGDSTLRPSSGIQMHNQLRQQWRMHPDGRKALTIDEATSGARAGIVQAFARYRYGLHPVTKRTVTKLQVAEFIGAQWRSEGSDQTQGNERCVRRIDFFNGGSRGNSGIELHRLLAHAAGQGWRGIHVVGDSELILRMMRERKEPKARRLKHWYFLSRKLADICEVASWSHNLRRHNKMADWLANLAMDRKCSVMISRSQAGMDHHIWKELEGHKRGDFGQWNRSHQEDTTEQEGSGLEAAASMAVKYLVKM